MKLLSDWTRFHQEMQLSKVTNIMQKGEKEREKERGREREARGRERERLMEGRCGSQDGGGERERERRWDSGGTLVLHGTLADGAQCDAIATSALAQP